MMTSIQLLRGCATLALTLAAGCDFLDVKSPTVVDQTDLNNGVGAELSRVGVVRLFQNTTVTYIIRDEGLFTDELRNELPTQTGFMAQDRRAPEAASFSAFSGYNNARNMATETIARMRANGTVAPYVGQMFAMRGFAKMMIAQDWCPGFAFNAVNSSTGAIIWGKPLTTEQAFDSALIDLDTAVALSTDSARIRDFSRVVRGRILLERGRYAEAATEVAPVATSYVYNIDQAGDQLFNFTTSRYSVNNNEGGVGLNFQAANDPRVKTQLRSTLPGNIPLYSAEKFAATTTPVAIVTGIEARLIEAEAALQANNATVWLATLNALRATAITPAMAALADPGTANGRVDLMFRERAFWLFLTAHRLGDMRRLMRQYGRTMAQVFPGGTRTAGDGGTWDMTVASFDLPTTETQNPNVTGCTSRTP